MNVIEQAAATARRIPSDGTPLQTQRIIDFLHAMKQQLLPCEATARAECEAKLKEAEASLECIDYPVMSTAPFTWRDNNGLPKLMPFSLAKQHVEISSDDNVRLRREFGVLSCVAPFYADVQQRVNELRARSESTVLYRCVVCTAIASYWFAAWRLGALNGTLTVFDMFVIAFGVVGTIVVIPMSVDSILMPSFACNPRDFFVRATFAGVIPPPVRELIRTAKGQFQEMFILAETPGLRIESKERPPQPSLVPDPLLIGFRNGKFYLLAKFDVTKLEDYAALEFAHKA